MHIRDHSFKRASTEFYVLESCCAVVFGSSGPEFILCVLQRLEEVLQEDRTAKPLIPGKVTYELLSRCSAETVVTEINVDFDSEDFTSSFEAPKVLDS